jgi:hypothetical protein
MLLVHSILGRFLLPYWDVSFVHLNTICATGVRAVPYDDNRIQDMTQTIRKWKGRVMVRNNKMQNNNLVGKGRVIVLPVLTLHSCYLSDLECRVDDDVITPCSTLDLWIQVSHTFSYCC